MDLSYYLEDRKDDIEALSVVPRDYRLTLSEEFVLTLVGPRRAGKSFLIYHIIKNLLELEREQYLYMNLEDPELDPRPTLLADAIRAHIATYGKHPKYLFFDEIQALEEWGRAVNALYESAIL